MIAAPTTDLRAINVAVKTLSDATLATLEASVTAFLQGAGTPALSDSARVHDVQIRYDGAVYFAVIVYSQ